MIRSSSIEPARSRSRLPGLTTQIFIGLLLGIVVGYLWPSFGVAVKPLADAFLRMIKMIIAPLVFATLVVGIAGTGDLKSMGRIGVKAIIYFEVATTIALFLGLALVNIFKPGAGLAMPIGADTSAAAAMAQNQQHAWDIFLHLFPDLGHRRDGARRHPAAGRVLDLLRHRASPRSARKGSRSSTCSRAPRRRCSSSPAT